MKYWFLGIAVGAVLFGMIMSLRPSDSTTSEQACTLVRQYRPSFSSNEAMAKAAVSYGFEYKAALAFIKRCLQK